MVLLPSVFSIEYMNLSEDNDNIANGFVHFVQRS